MIYTVGESLLDIIFSSEEEIIARPGGSMLNTSVSLARCGIAVNLISELGDDKTAGIILDFLKANKVHTRYIKSYYHHNTSVAIAFLDSEKVPSFSIHKSYPELRRLILPEELSKDDILFFGSFYSLDPGIRSQIVEFLSMAKQNGAMLCYDPNIRKHNLDDPQIRNAILENIGMADLVKASLEDLENIFGDQTADQYHDEINKINPGAIFIVTRGGEGATGFSGRVRIDLPARPVEVVSTIGAGDAFSAGVVYAMTHTGNDRDDEEKWLQSIMESGISFSAAVCGTMDNYVGRDFRKGS